MPLPNDLSKDIKALVASNLTTALAILTAAGQPEAVAQALINGWFAELSAPSQEGKPLFPELSE